MSTYVWIYMHRASVPVREQQQQQSNVLGSSPDGQTPTYVRASDAECEAKSAFAASCLLLGFASAIDSSCLRQRRQQPDICSYSAVFTLLPIAL